MERQVLREIQAIHNVIKEKSSRKKRRWNVRPLNATRLTSGEYMQLVRPMRVIDPEQHRRYFRMSRGSFSFLLSKIEEKITHCNTHKQPISADERLALTLRFLAHGGDQLSIAHSYHMSPASVSNIVREVCSALADVLFKEFVKAPKTWDWRKIEERFLEKCGFPNCVGSIDGKHCNVKAPPNSGSLYYNYKGSFSILLLAVTDADFVFRLVVVGDYGSTGDAAIFSREFRDKLERNKLGLPPPTIPNGHDQPLPHVLVGDQAFPIQVNLMKPFSTQQALTKVQEIFNIRLCTARRTVECSFGMLATVWRVLAKRMDVIPDTADKIIRACVGLHNFLRYTEGIEHSRLYQNLCAGGPGLNLENASNLGGFRGSVHAYSVRDEFAKFFSGGGAVEWQNSRIQEGLVLSQPNN